MIVFVTKISKISSSIPMVSFKTNPKLFQNVYIKWELRCKILYLFNHSNSLPLSILQAGDFVLVRVYNQTKKTECFVPGIVEVTPEDARHHAKFYSVLLYNGQRVGRSLSCIIA